MFSNKFSLLKEQSDGKFSLRYYGGNIEGLQFIDLDLDVALYDLAKQGYQPQCETKEGMYFVKKNIFKKDPK